MRQNKKKEDCGKNVSLLKVYNELMKKFTIQVIALLIVIFGSLYLAYNSNILNSVSNGNLNFSGNENFKVASLKIGETTVKVEVADTLAKRTQGLSGRETLATDSGMLFVFPDRTIHRFWMKGMKFPLDFIFIDKGAVVDLLKSVPPPGSNTKEQNLPTYVPNAPINMMVEVNTGFIESNQIKVGDQVSLRE